MTPRSAGRGLLLAVALITTSSAAISEPLPPVKVEVPAKQDAEPLDMEALGRREAARIAAGRVEVSVLASADVGSRQRAASVRSCEVAETVIHRASRAGAGSRCSAM